MHTFIYKNQNILRRGKEFRSNCSFSSSPEVNFFTLFIFFFILCLKSYIYIKFSEILCYFLWYYPLREFEFSPSGCRFHWISYEIPIELYFISKLFVIKKFKTMKKIRRREILLFTAAIRSAPYGQGTYRASMLMVTLSRIKNKKRRC